MADQKITMSFWQFGKIKGQLVSHERALRKMLMYGDMRADSLRGPMGETLDMLHGDTERLLRALYELGE